MRGPQREPRIFSKFFIENPSKSHRKDLEQKLSVSSRWVRNSLVRNLLQKIILRPGYSKIGLRLSFYSISQADCISDLVFTNAAWEDALRSCLCSRGVLVILPGVTHSSSNDE